MKKTVYFHDFEQAFRDHDRMNNFSHIGLRVLYDHLIEMETFCGLEYELDVIGLCCDYSQSTFEEVADTYSNMFTPDYSGLEDEEGNIPTDDSTQAVKADFLKQQVLEFLYDHTSVAGEVDEDSVIYVEF